jgi:predicted XRE-type DNA-binding protein
MFDVIVQALANVAKLTEVQAVSAHMATAWQADRKDLLAKMDLLEQANEKMTDNAVKQAEIINTLKAKQPKTDLKVKMEQAAAKGKEIDDLKRRVESLTKQLEAARASQLAKAS